MKLKAILFDVDGTIAETEEAHRRAFNQAFAEAGRRWSWSVEEYRKLLAITGGRERIRHFAGGIGEAATDTEIAAMHVRKNRIYAKLVEQGDAALRPGVARLIDEARAAGVRLAIATTTSRANLMALLKQHFGPQSLNWFDAIITGEDVARKKPDPQVYALALATLGLDGRDCLAIEDSRNGLISASSCGIPVLVTPSLCTSHELFDGAAAICPSLDDPAPVDLLMLDRLVGVLQPLAMAS